MTEKTYAEKCRNEFPVEKGVFSYDHDFLTENGQLMPEIKLSYEIYGRLNAERSNAVLICHPLTADAHAAGFNDGDRKPGWWDIVIGPKKAFDTKKFCIICSNVLGGCKGSTGPSSVNPETGRVWGADFPVITIGDMVNAQKLMTDSFGIKCLFAVAGGSMGGMQVLQWAVSYPDMVRKAVVIASAASQGPQQIAFNAIGRRAITQDPDWNGGSYYEKTFPGRGLALARMIGHTTYLSPQSMAEKFGRDTISSQKCPESAGVPVSRAGFQVESYLDRQGGTFSERFDANSYLYITKAADLFDLKKGGSLRAAMSKAKAGFLVVAITSDWLYPPEYSEEIVSAVLENDGHAEYSEIRSHKGHDAFLIEGGQLNYILGRFLSQICSGDVMSETKTIDESDFSVEKAARLLIENGINHLPVTGKDKKICGIVTSWDIAKAVACGAGENSGIITRSVVCTGPEEPVGDAAGKMAKNQISALPVVDDDGRILGIVTGEGLSRLIGGGSL
ncbi:homoserine O-acetyltransferase [Methanomicrobium sp. W14]|uniref:homoserine O-acetyltransferase MetX n=1 Tax=Methanomicrobium sp. W14 TaxID=2817839 RepID=UPI001AEB9D63|nr:homoserine O-acetyltransferase [Methanomicrobium sp. W14]MBP2134172.1 homoserine O-acetyltransferase [Methanomicrobium sp. W14]